MRNSFYYSLNNIIAILVSFIVFGIFTALVIRPELVYYQQQPLFLFSVDFALGHFSQYGGLAEYISLFFSQFLISNTAGFFILTFFAIITSILLYLILNRIFGLSTISLFVSLPVILLVKLHSSYSHTLMPDIVVILSLLFYYMYIRVLHKGFIVRGPVFLTICFESYFLAGGTSLMLFAILSIISEIATMYNKKFSVSKAPRLYNEKFSNKTSKGVASFGNTMHQRKLSDKRNKNGGSSLDFSKLPVLILFTSVALLIPFLGAYLFDITLQKSYLHFFMPEAYYEPSVFLYLFYAVFPCTILFFYFSGENFFFQGISSIIIQGTLAVSLFVIVIIKSYDIQDKDVALIEYYADKQDWNKVLEIAGEKGSSHLFTNVRTNQALFHLGMLTSNLFVYPQNWGTAGLVPEKFVTRKTAMTISDIYFDLGLANIANRWALEAYSFFPNSPKVLQRLALANLVMGKDIAARKFLQKLEGSLIYKEWAQTYMKYIDNKQLKESDPFFADYYKKLPIGDFFAISITPSLTLKELSSDNPSNKMAFEYFMANALINKNIVDIYNFRDTFKTFGYEKIPPLFQEALILYYYKIGKTGEDILNFPEIEKKQLDEFLGFNAVIQKYRNKPQLAQKDLRLLYKNSYLYYITYNYKKDK
jgi:hypothetical protein